MELESKDHRKREKQEKRSEWEIYGEVTLFQFYRQSAAGEGMKRCLYHWKDACQTYCTVNVHMTI